MSAFGYGKSYSPQFNAEPLLPQDLGPAVSRNAPQDPMSFVPGLNFNPEVTEAWQDPGRTLVNERRVEGRGPVVGFLDPGGRRRVREYVQNPWDNPLTKNFTGILGGFENQEQSKQFNPSGLGAGDMLSEKDGRPGQVDQVKNLDQLDQQIASLSGDQLRKLDMNKGAFQESFQNAAQDFSNAYANKDYAQGRNPNLQQSQGYLEQAYNNLYKRLNDAYLL